MIAEQIHSAQDVNENLGQLSTALARFPDGQVAFDSPMTSQRVPAGFNEPELNRKGYCFVLNSPTPPAQSSLVAGLNRRTIGLR
jgi:hypothetical protein